MKAGLNLFSIKNLLDTEENFLATAYKLKEMGYSYIQFSGAPYDSDMIARVSSASQLPVVLTHVPMDRILNDTDALMLEHDKFGCKNIGLGMMPLATILNKEELYKTVEALDNAGAKMNKNGFKFFYHHHHFEFYKYDGETVFDYILKNAENINFTLDSYWLQFGGVDICKTVDKLKGRIECVHMKDYMIAIKAGEKLEVKPRFAPVGDGTIDFKAFVEHATAAGAKYFLVEQDNASKLPDTLGQVERSIKYITENL